MRVEKTFLGFQDTVSLMFLSKNLLFRTLGSQIQMNLFGSHKLSYTFILLKFCQETLSDILRCNNLFDQILLNSAPADPPSNFLSITIPRLAGWTLGSKNGRAMRVEKSIPGFQYTLSLMFLSKNLLFRTLGSQIINE